MGLPPHTPPSGRPLDRVYVTPKPPSGGFPLPSPRGGGGKLLVCELLKINPYRRKMKKMLK